jgi:hypothetical protein
VFAVALVILTRRNVAALKSSLLKAFPEIGSGHADEALAAGVGFRSHAALLAALKVPSNAQVTVLLDERLLGQRIKELSGQDIAAEKLPFWVLRQAVEALPENNGAARRAVYEEARAALAGQLRAALPSQGTHDITAHRLQLENFIRLLEQEASGAGITGVSGEPVSPWPSPFGDWWKHVANEN